MTTTKTKTNSCTLNSCTHKLARAANGGTCPTCDKSEADEKQKRIAELTAEIELLRTQHEQQVQYCAVSDGVAAMNSLAEFVKQAWPIINPATELEWGKHLDAMCWHIERQLTDRAAALTNRQKPIRAQNLVINIPPRCLKTTILVCANAWAWIHWPNMRIIYLSSNPSVTLQSARWFRDIVSSNWYQQSFVNGKWQMRADQDALSDLGNTAGGTRRAMGLLAKIVGLGADWLAIDDPHDLKDGVEQIKKACDEYDAAVANRVNDPRTALRTLIMQRVATHDLTARVLASGDWLHLRLPARYKAGPVCTSCKTCVGFNKVGWRDWRRPGERLHDRLSDAFLSSELKRLGARGYAGQMDQDPKVLEGELFKAASWAWASMHDESPRDRPQGCNSRPSYVIPRRKDGSLDIDWLCVTVDPTQGSTSPDASALGVLIVAGKAERRIVLRDLTDGPKTWTQTIDLVKSAVRIAGQVAGKQRKFIVLIEKKAMGASEGAALPTQLREALADGEITYPDGTPIAAKVELYEPTGKGSKIDRANHLEPDVEAGLLLLLDGEPWLNAFVDELGVFPAGTRDDRVDALSQCVDHFRKRGNDGISGWL